MLVLYLMGLYVPSGIVIVCMFVIIVLSYIDDAFDK